MGWDGKYNTNNNRNNNNGGCDRQGYKWKFRFHSTGITHMHSTARPHLPMTADPVTTDGPGKPIRVECGVQEETNDPARKLDTADRGRVIGRNDK